MGGLDDICHINTNAQGTAGAESFTVAGDVSATNVILAIYPSGEKGPTLFQATYCGQGITDFNDVLDHALGKLSIKRENVESGVLSPAGAISTDRLTAEMTNATFSVDISNIGFKSVALINDFAAKGYTICGLGLQLPHIKMLAPEGYEVKALTNGNIAIAGPGTGCGTCEVRFDPVAGKYFPHESEMQHGRIPTNRFDRVSDELLDFVTVQYTNLQDPSWEDLLTGEGIQRITGFFYEKLSRDEKAKYNDDLVELGQMKRELRARTIGKWAKERPDSIYAKAMDQFWKFYGNYLHAVAMAVIPTKGIYSAGGITCGELPSRENRKKPDPNINNIINEGLYSGNVHRHWLDHVPHFAITERRMGLIGALEVAVTPEYMQRELARQQKE